MILAKLGGDDQMLCAALLHDVAEYTPCTLGALRTEFGTEIADLVDGVMALDTAELPAGSSGGTAALAVPGDSRAVLIKLADRLHNMRTLRYVPPAKQIQKARQTLEVAVPLARTLQLDAISAELSSLAIATLRRRGQRPRTASGHLLAAATALLPASARARWREEWLAELHVLSTRRERVTFAAHIVLGIGRLAVTLYQPAAALKRACSTVLAAAATAGGLVLGGWQAAATVSAAILTAAGTLTWILHSDQRTDRLTQLIHALRGRPPREP
jgi:hypothetical protein